MYVSRVSSAAIESISNFLHVSRVCLKPLGRPANRLSSYCCQEVRSPSTGPTSTPPRSCRRGIRAKREELRLRTSCLVITTRPDDCRLRSTNRSISCRRLKTITWTDGPIDSSKTSPSIHLVMVLATSALNTRTLPFHRHAYLRQKRREG